jgi:hypothetical protein
MFAIAATVQSGGTGYAVNDVLTVVGGTYSSQATFTVSSVSGGVVTAVTLSSGGTSYSVLPTNPVSTTGGTGSGCTLNITSWGVSTFTITNAGSGYVEQPTVSFSGGGGSGAAAYAVVGSTSVLRNLSNTLQFQTPGGTQFAVSDSAATSNAYWQAVGGAGTADLRTAGGSVSSGAFSTQTAIPLVFRTNFTEQFRVAHTASAVNYVQVTGGATANGPAITAQGSDTNVRLRLAAKNAEGVQIEAGGVRQLYVGPITSAVNYFYVQGATAGQAPSIAAVGSDTNIDLNLTTKGTGAVVVSTGSGKVLSVTNHPFTSGGTNVNFVQAFGGQTGFSAGLTATGTDANVVLAQSSRGSSPLQFYTNSFGAEQLRVSNTSSAVNYVQVSGGVTGGAATIQFTGSDANVLAGYFTKGSGSHSFYSAAGASRQVRIDGANASAVNYLDFYGASASSAPSVRVGGSDTNIDLTLTPKGTGNVRFGTLTASADAAITGYITIKDSGGTVRKLAVIA